MIKCVLIINNHGKPRLTKFYEQLAVDKQQELLRTVFTVVTHRADNLCSFVEDEALFGKDTKLIYRHFATLYFIVLCDKSESELGILDLIQVYVETLDRSFESVCELDLIFNSPKAYAILDEIVMGGAVFETSSLEALRAFNELQRLEKSSDSLSSSSPASASKFGRR